MTAKAYVLVETHVGRSKEVTAIIKKLPAIASVDQVTGPYDIIVIVEADDLNNVGAIVTDLLHPIDGIARTVTCLAV